MTNMALVPALTLEEAVERYNDLGRFVKTVLKEGLDFGVIPGTNKPTLFKPGSEKLCALFGLVPQFSEVEVVEDWTGKDHGGEPFFYYKIRCQLTKNGVVMADCIGSCNSWETRYRFRNAGRICPQCGKDAIIKGKVEYGGGWVCFKNKGGCGFKFKDDDKSITDQKTGKTPNAEIFDQVNTLVKQASKRAMVGATLIGANASEYFTQDMEDIVIQGEWKDVPDDKPKEKPVAKPEAIVRNTAPAEPEFEDEWRSPSEEKATEAPVPVIAETPWEENGIIYRKHDGAVQVKFGSEWRPALDQAKLSLAATKQIEALFKNGFELEGHLYKHFQVKKLNSLNWTQVLALLNFKKKDIRHPIYYATSEAEPPKVEAEIGTLRHELEMFFEDVKYVAPEGAMNNFLDEVTKASDPKSFKVLMDAGLNLKEHGDELTSIVSIIIASPEDYPLFVNGKLSPQVKELVDHARSSAN